jgi:hypothetical protein
LSCFQHREGIYWHRNEEERSYKVRAATDVLAAPQPPIEEYISDSSVGSNEDAPATRRTPPKFAVSASRCTWQTTSKMSASQAAATIAATQTAEAKKKKRKRTEPAVSANTATVSYGNETINVDDDEDDAKLPSTVTDPSVGTPHKAASTEERAMEMPPQDVDDGGVP